MCLDRIDDSPIHEMLESGIGYKVFYKEDCFQIRFLHYDYHSSTIVPHDRWLEAEHNEHRWILLEGFAGKYRPGFHIYLESAPGDTLVYYRGGRTLGEESGKKVIVADWMYVPHHTTLSLKEIRGVVSCG